MGERWVNKFLVTAVVLTMSGSALARGPAASADPDPITQKLYDEATVAMDANRYDIACPKLEEVNRRVPDGVGARLTLAQCYEGADKLASALAQYSIAADAAARATQADRHAKALRQMNELKRRVATLQIDVPAALRGIPEAAVSLDGSSLNEADWGSARPIDKGVHELVVSAPGKRTLEQAVVIDSDGTAKKVKVALEDVAPTPPPPLMPAAKRWQLPTGVAFSAAGVTTAAVGLGFGALALERKSAAEKDCNAALACNSDGMTSRQQAKSFANVSTALLVVGGVSTAAGVVVLVTAPSSKKTTPSGTTAKLSVGPMSLALRGSFE